MSCDTELHGVYCHACSEKVISDEDFEVKRLASTYFSNLTNVDSKLFKTISSLIFKPGALTYEYFRGTRSQFLSPFQIFILVSVLFYIIVRDFDIFYVPSKWYFVHYTDFLGLSIPDLITTKLNETSLTRNELALVYDMKVGNNSKLFLFLAIPALALGSYVMRFKKAPEFGKHIIFATHCFCFVLLWFTFIFTLAFSLPFPDKTPDYVYSGAAFLGPIIYFIFAAKKAWSEKFFFAVLSSLVFFAGIFVFLNVYRICVSYITLRYL